MKQVWEIKKLGEVCEIINGFAFKSQLFREEGDGILRISNIQNGYVDLTDIAHFSKDDYPKTSFEKYAVLPNDIVVALSGATTGKFGINKTGKKLYLNQRVAICRESSSKLNHLFLLYYLQTRSKSFLESAEGVAQPNLSTEQMKQYDIPIPPREEQEMIVEELDCLSGVIEKKREQLRELDALAKSIFYQMFGDPITNEKGWEVKKLGEVAYIGLGFTHTPEYVEDGVAFLSVKDISSGEICWDNIKYVSRQEYDSAPKGAKPNKGDIMFCRVGTMGKPVIVDTDIPFCTFVSLGYLHILDEDILNIYVKYWMQSYAFDVQVEENVKGVAIKNLNTGWLKTFNIQHPPISLQQEFADKIEAIEKQKELIKKSISEVEDLFNSRMSYYFN